jgi:hypothetical protein
MALTVNRLHLTAEDRVRSDASPCQICDTHTGIGKCFSPSTSVFPCQYQHKCSTFIFIYMLLLPEGQMGEAWEASKKQCSFGNWGSLERKVLSHSFSLQTALALQSSSTKVYIPCYADHTSAYNTGLLMTTLNCHKMGDDVTSFTFGFLKNPHI